MAFKAVLDLSADTTISLGGTNRKTGKKNPNQVEGYYLGNKKVADTKKKAGFSYIYIFQTAQGNLGIWGKTDLDRKMSQAPIGAMVRATHTGMVPTPNGEMYKYSVEVDTDNTIEVSGTTTDQEPVAEGYAEDAAGTLDASDTDETYDTALADEEEERQNQALAAAERKAKVQALLNGKGKRA